VLNLELGTTLNERFTLKERLGNGAFGTVYLAEDNLREEDVAVKIMEVGPCSPEIATLQLQNEKKVHGKIGDHLHVIQVHDLHYIPWGGSGLMLLSMEYADEGTFRMWLSERQEDPNSRRTEGLDFFKQACFGVKAIHEAGLVHLDLKPDNFLFVVGALKVADLGTAINVQALRIMSGGSWGGEGSEMGTPEYMSPEHFTAAHPDEVDERADIYSLGIILFELLHPKSRRPFGWGRDRLSNLHCNIPAPVLPEAGEIAARVTARCLEKDPDARYQNVDELLDALEGREEDFPYEIADDDDGRDHLSEEMVVIWESAVLCMDEGNFDRAQSLCRTILEACPENHDANEMLAEIQTRYEQAEKFYKTIERDIDSQGLSELVDLMMEAVEIYPEHPSGRLVQVQLAAKVDRFAKSKKEGIEAASNGQFEMALSYFEQAKEIHPDDTGTIQSIDVLSRALEHRTEMRKLIDQASNEGNDERAMALARSLDRDLDQLKESAKEG